jgi:tetratricopeptide (TPR) repeat protein
MRILRYVQILTLLVSLSFFSCKSHKGAGSKQDDVSYNTRKVYNQHYYEGAKLKAIGDYVAAAREFNLALAEIPNSHEAMYQLANIYFKDKKLDEAIHWAELAVKKNPDYNFWYFGQLAQMYSTAKQYSKSAETFATMVAKEPERKSNYEEAGNQYLNDKKPFEAVKYFEKSISKFGPEESICRKLEALYFDLGQPNEANRIVKKLSDTYPSDIKFLGLLAESYTKANKISEAKAVYLKMLQLDATNGYASFGMADIMRREGKNDESFFYLSKGFADKRVSISHKIKVISSYYFLVTKDEKSKKQAFELSQKLLEAHPEDATSYQVYSDMLLAAAMLDESREYMKKGLAIDGKDYRVWQKLFGIDVKLSNNQFLYDDSKLALELFATQPGLFIIHSQAALRIGNYDKAIETAMQGLDISFKADEKIQLFLTLGDAWFEKGNYDKSDEYFEKALEVDQQNASALNDYAYNLFKRNTKLQKAEEMVLKALDLEPNSGSYADTYGCILMATGKLAEAEKWIKKALELEGENAEILEHLGDVYAKQGKNALAIEAYKKALSLEPQNKSISAKLGKLG